MKRVIWGNEPGRGKELFLTVGPGKAGTARDAAAYSDSGSVATQGDGSYVADHVVNVDPRFVDPASQDFRLRQGSPAVDAGDPDPSYDDRLRPPAMGAGRNDMGGLRRTGEPRWAVVDDWKAYEAARGGWSWTMQLRKLAARVNPGGGAEAFG